MAGRFTLATVLGLAFCLPGVAYATASGAQPLAVAASPAPDRGPQLEVELADFPISVGPADSLTVSLNVINKGAEPVSDLEVNLVIFRGVRSRSELSLTYQGSFGRQIASDTIAVEGSIEARSNRVIEVSKPLSELDAFRDSSTDRAYPVRITVRSGESAADPVDTHMVYFSQTPEKPLGVGLIVPLHSPSMYTDGSRPNVVTTDSLEKSVTTGRLSMIIKALEDYPNLPVTLAPSGLLISMLQDMSDGYVRSAGRGTTTISRDDPRAIAAANALNALRALVARPTTRLIATSYSPTSLPALNRFELDDLTVTQLTEGRNILKAEPVGLLRAQPMQGWLLPAGGDLDDATLTELQRSDSNRLILSSRSVRSDSGILTRGLPVKVEGGSGSATSGLEGIETVALVTDAGLNTQLANNPEQGEITLGEGDRVTPEAAVAKDRKRGVIEARQRFAAETATIQLESPGVVRAVVALTPLDWRVEPGSVQGLLETLSKSPWLITTTPDQIVDQLEAPEAQAVRLAKSESVLENIQTLPPASYFAALAEARTATERYAVLAPPPAQLGALTRQLLIAQSADWWFSRTLLNRGLRFARAISDTVSGEMKLIRAPAPQTITLTSRTGVIPLSVGSALNYPVDVVIRLESDKLRFPDGNRIDIAKLRPPNQTIRVRAITQSSGTFPLHVRVFTPGGQLVSNSQLTIRSTAYNIVALSITAGAALFLVGWWAIGAVRRRRT